MSNERFTYRPESALMDYQFTIEGDRYCIGCFENVNRPEDASLGYAVAMCRRLGPPLEYTWQKVVVSNRLFEHEMDSLPSVEGIVSHALNKFNDYLREQYGEDADLTEFEEFIRDISEGLGKFKVKGHQFVESE